MDGTVDRATTAGHDAPGVPAPDDGAQGREAAGPVAARLPLRARWNLWFRRRRFAWALRLVRGMDGALVSKAALDAAMLELAKLPGWVDDALHGRPKLAAAFTARVETAA